MKSDYGQAASKRLREKARAILARKGTPDDRLPDRIDNVLEDFQLSRIELELQGEELETARRELDRLRFSVDHAQEGQFWIRADGSFADVNESVCRTLGYTRDELLGMKVSDIDPGSSAGDYAQVWKRTKEAGGTTFESVLRARDGSVFPVELASSFFVYEGVEYNHTVARNITERKRILDILGASEEKYRSLVERAQDGIAIVSEGLLKLVNPALAKMLGSTVEEMLDKSFEQFVAPDLLDEVRENYRARMAGESVPQNYESAVVHRDGHRIEVEYNTAKIDYEGSPASLTIVRDTTERRQAEEQQRLLSSIVKQTGEGIALVDLEGNVQFANDAFAIMHGFSPEELIGKNLSIFHTPEQMPSVDEANRQIRETGSFKGEIWSVRRDGSLFVTSMNNSLMRDETGEAVGMIGVMRDISKSKEAEMYLRLQRDLAFSLASAQDLEPVLNLVLESLVGLDGIDCGAVYRADNERNVFDIMAHRGLSDAFVEKFSVIDARTTVKGKLVSRGLPVYGRHSDSMPTVQEPEGHGVLKGLAVIPVSFRSDPVAVLALSSRTCDEIPVSSRHALETVAAQVGATIVRVRAEEDFKTSERRYAELFDSVIEGIGIVDENEITTFCNPAMANIMEEDSVEAMVGKSMLDYFPESQQAAILAETAKRKRGLSSQYEQEVVTAKGSRRNLHLSISPRFDESGNYAGAFGAVLDITETRRLQDLAERARRLETAGQVAGQVAHDFNNLLGPLLAYPDLIRAELDPDHRVLTYLQDIATAATQMADINQQLLTLGRRGHYNQAPLNLNHLIREALDRTDIIPKNVTVDARLDEDIMNVRGGAAQLDRVLLNLIGNGVDGMDGVGRLTIKSQNYYVDTQARSYERIPRGEFVKITVSDTGSGISADVISKIFDPFFTTKTSDRKRGSGLGLSVVHAVVRDHQGYIDVSSRPGEGTSFYLYFPITRDEVEIVDSPELAGGDESILIVDDDSLQRDVSAALLGKLGYRVQTVSSGEEALRRLGEESFDLLVLDMVMPPGMDGADTFERVRSTCAGQKAIIVSGFAETARVQRAQKLGAGEFVKKPLSMEAIARAVRRELDRPDN